MTEAEYQYIILIHYHEIGLKGRNRSTFEYRLINNLKSLLRAEPIVTIHRISGRLCIFIKEGCSFDVVLHVAKICKKVPGVARVSCGFKTPRTIDDMNRAAVLALKQAEPFVSFKVQARRNHTDFDINSMEMNKIIGAELCAHYPEKKVQMKEPDVQVGVEVVQNAAYVYAYSFSAIGGLPVGSSGRLMCLLSSGIDSPVALWRMARRGAICMGVHFSGRPQTAPTSEYLVDDIAHVLEQSGCISRVFIVPFGSYQKQISLIVPPHLRIIMYRRLMFKIVEQLAQQYHAKGIVTGESLGQVASQTLENLEATSSAVSLPVYRPLIGTDKLEIISMAQQLGTFDISSSDAPDCCTLFMPKSPETHAKIDIVEKAEALLPLDEWIPEILSQVEMHNYVCPSFKSSH